MASDYRKQRPEVSSATGSGSRSLPDLIDAAAGLEVHHYVGKPTTFADLMERLAVVLLMFYAHTLRSETPLDPGRLRGQALAVIPEAAEWPLAFDIDEGRKRQEAKHGGGWWRRKGR